MALIPPAGSAPKSEAFWGRSARWWQSNVTAAREAAADGIRLPDDQRRALARLKSWGRVQAIHTRRGTMPVRSGWSIHPDPSLASDLTRIIAQSRPRLIAAMDEVIGGLALEAWDTAPVDSGIYRGLLQLDYRQEGDRLVAQIKNETPYAIYAGKPKHWSLVRASGAGAYRELGQRVLSELVGVIRGR